MFQRLHFKNSFKKKKKKLCQDDTFPHQIKNGQKIEILTHLYIKCLMLSNCNAKWSKWHRAALFWLVAEWRRCLYQNKTTASGPPSCHTSPSVRAVLSGVPRTVELVCYKRSVPKYSAAGCLLISLHFRYDSA